MHKDPFIHQSLLRYTTNMILSFIKKIRATLRRIFIGHISDEHIHLQKKLECISLAIGKQESRTVTKIKTRNIQDAEFQVFSQFGEDGIIQYLIHTVPIKNKTFIEFGVGNYEESNTRFLLMNDNWKGLIVNQGTEHLEYLQSEMGKSLPYLHQLEAVSAYITTSNVNTIITQAGIHGDIGVLSIDLDGVDYWIFEAITAVSPRIIILEYNSVFGNTKAITVPNKEIFDRHAEHYSNLYFGASLQALCMLAKKKGYVCVGSNSAGNNAFFVRKDVARFVPHCTAKQSYVKNMYRESSDKNGNLTYISSPQDQLACIANMRVMNVHTHKMEKIC